MTRNAVLFAVGTLLAASAFDASAAPKPASGSDQLCSGFDKTLEGVWKDPSGHETLLFRLAKNADGSGCYAWLNAVSHWNIGSPGSVVLNSVSQTGSVWTTDNGTFAVMADTSDGTAIYERGGRKTKGKLF